ncbi:MAG: ABC transporter ATP-binding protein [Deltaproteobacteria bacterium]|nr:ABC transporter ATP-binding protein [Deltaproteobacteria bacterium]
MSDATISVRGVSKLFGLVRALDEIDLELGPGVTGLLGPNGSGKSTLLKLISGQLRPDTGEVRVLGRDPFADPQAMAAVGLCPEHDRFYEELRAIDFVTALVQLHGYPRAAARARAEAALGRVALERVWNKPLREMSRGMRQRVKIGQAIAHDPAVVLLDEPLTGTDPVGRADLIALVTGLGEAGATVVVSSHVLHEVEAMTPRVVLIRYGRLRAQGNIRRLRALLGDRPYRIRLEVDRPRDLAARLVHTASTRAVVLVDERTLELTCVDLDAALVELPALADELGMVLYRMTSPDADLESLYGYLVS